MMHLLVIINSSVYPRYDADAFAKGSDDSRRRDRNWLWKRRGNFKRFVHPRQVKLAKHPNVDRPVSEGLQQSQIQLRKYLASVLKTHKLTIQP